MGCLNCGKDVVQPVGKAKKLYCNSTCRSNHFQRKKRLGKDPDFFATKREGKLAKKQSVPVPEIELTFMSVLEFAKGGASRKEVEAAIEAKKTFTAAQQDLIRRKIKDP